VGQVTSKCREEAGQVLLPKGNQKKPAVGSKKLVRGLDINDEEDWAADDVKVLQEDVEEQEHHARDANISM